MNGSQSHPDSPNETRRRSVVLAAPRGYCAGVTRAVDIVERALELHGPPVYVRKEIVHNQHVVKEFRARGVVFVESEEEAPAGATCVLSAHGVSPEVRRNAAKRHLRVIDATCPLVTKVHTEARRFARQGRTIVLIGHAEHEEVEGTAGEAPDRTLVVDSVEALDALRLPRDTPIGYLTQTTLAVDDTRHVVEALRERFDDVQGPPTSDICYASQNRQVAVKLIAPQCELVLVVGARNSSNSNRLVEVAREAGTDAHLAPDETFLDEAWLDGVETVGLTAGASAPEILVTRVLSRLAKLGYQDVRHFEATSEDVTFSLPAWLRSGAGRRPDDADGVREA